MSRMVDLACTIAGVPRGLLHTLVYLIVLLRISEFLAMGPLLVQALVEMHDWVF